VLACVDVAYREGSALAGCVLFEAWTDERPAKEITAHIGPAHAYRSGEFYRRELPAILAVLKRVDEPLEAVVIDAYVWLGGDRPGLGAKLYEALGTRVPIIGVAKTVWGDPSTVLTSPDERRAIPLRRGRSDKPLYVTSAGMDVGLATKLVAGMHGAHRIPTLIKEVDRLVRQARSCALP
jgi:deoxyribonuclease V